MYDAHEVVGIAILCNDPRANLWKPTKALLIPEGKILAPIMVFGGAVPLIYPQYLSTDHHGLLGQLHFGKSTFPTIEEFLVVLHDCGRYADIPGKHTIAHKKADGEKIADFLVTHFGLPTTVFFAHPHPEGKADFDTIKFAKP